MPRNRVIPRKFHYVWVGGDIREHYLRELKSVAALAKRSDIEMNLWVDKESNYYHVTAKNPELSIPNLRIRNIQELKAMACANISAQNRTAYNSAEYSQAVKSNATSQQNDDSPGVKKQKISPDDLPGPIFFSAEDEKKIFYYLTTEMVGFVNYAASSDSLRELILFHEGGYYFDTDLIPKIKMNLQPNRIELPKAPEGFIVLLLPDLEETLSLQYPNSINCAMGAAPYHDTTIHSLSLIKQKYEALYQSAQLAEAAFNVEKAARCKEGKVWSEFMHYYQKIVLRVDNTLAHKRLLAKDTNDRKELTIDTSGPTVLNTVISDYAKITQCEDEAFLGHKHPLVFLTEEIINANNNNSSPKPTTNTFSDYITSPNSPSAFSEHLDNESIDTQNDCHSQDSTQPVCANDEEEDRKFVIKFGESFSYVMKCDNTWLEYLSKPRSFTI